MRVTTHHRRNAFIATTAATLTIAAAGPAVAGQGDPGPGGPIRYMIDATHGTCDWNTGKDSITVTLTQGPDYPTWQYVGVFFEEKPPGSWDNLADVSHDTAAGGSWIGPGSAPVTVTFEAPTLPQGYSMEIDTIDDWPKNDGYYIDGTGLPMASPCFPIGILHLLSPAHTAQTVRTVHTF
jgi:hypothetical protein